MSLAKTHSDRSPQDLSHLIFQVGNVGLLTTLSCVPVCAGDSFQDNLVGSFRFSPMRRGLSLDPKVEIFSFYVPHRHIYGDQWVDFIKEGYKNTFTPTTLKGVVECNGELLEKLGIGYEKKYVDPDYKMRVSKWRHDGYDKIWQNYFVRPGEKPNTFGVCCHLKNIWTAPLSLKQNQPQVAVEDNVLNLYQLNKQAAAFNNEQSRQNFAVRYRDLMDSFGGGTTADVDQRPTLLAHTEFWGSGYDVDGTSETSLGQYSGRVTASFSHNVPRFFCMEHGAIWTVALVRFPTVTAAEAHALTTMEPNYSMIVNDPVVTANMGTYGLSGAHIFPSSSYMADKQIPVAHGAWYREQPNYVSGVYSELQGYPFLEGNQVGGWEVPVTAYDEIFQTSQLKHWQINARSNASVLRTIPTARQTFMLDPDA